MLLLKKGVSTILLLMGTYSLISVTFKKNEYVKSNLSEKTYTLTIVVTSLRNNDGKIQLDVYKNQKEFEARYSNKERRIYLPKKNLVNGTVTFVFKNLPEGTYGVAIMDDENSNGKIDYGWVLPSEGFGFGDYWHQKWRTPTFDDFKFNLQTNKTVTVKAKYY